MEERKKDRSRNAAVLNYIITEEAAICIQSMAAPGVKAGSGSICCRAGETLGRKRPTGPDADAQPDADENL